MLIIPLYRGSIIHLLYLYLNWICFFLFLSLRCPCNAVVTFFFCRWFQGFHWQGLLERTLEPPIKPKVFNITYNFIRCYMQCSTLWGLWLTAVARKRQREYVANSDTIRILPVCPMFFKFLFGHRSQSCPLPPSTFLVSLWLLYLFVFFYVTKVW